MPILSKKECVRIARNGFYAMIIRVIVGLLKSLLKNGMKKSLLKALLGELTSLDPWKWAAVITGLSSFRWIQRVLLSLGATEEVASVGSGAMSALPALVMHPKTRTELMLYFLARAIHCISINEVLPRLPKPLQEFEHYDVVTMMVTSSEILYSFVFLPKCHLPSYQGFLQRATMADGRTLAGTAATHRRVACPEVVQIADERGLTFDPKIPDTAVMCKLYHPGHDCNVSFARFTAKHFLNFTMPLYLPLKCVTTVALHGGRALKDPLSTTLKILKSSARSSAFLSLYCSLAMRIICMFAQRNIRSDIGIAAAVGIVTGATTLIEEKQRRLDLAIYCLMQSIRSTTLLLFHRGICSLPGARTQMLLYVTCVSYLLRVYNGKSNLHPTVSKMFGMLLGESRESSPKEEIDVKQVV